MSPSYTRPYLLVAPKGQGAVIEDVDGNRFLDCAAGIAVATTGHSHPDVVRAIVEQARRLLQPMPYATLRTLAARAGITQW